MGTQSPADFGLSLPDHKDKRSLSFLLFGCAAKTAVLLELDK